MFNLLQLHIPQVIRGANHGYLCTNQVKIVWCFQVVLMIPLRLLRYQLFSVHSYGEGIMNFQNNAGIDKLSFVSVREKLVAFQNLTMEHGKLSWRRACWMKWSVSERRVY